MSVPRLIQHAPAPWTAERTVLRDARGLSIASGGNNRTIVGAELEASLRLAAAAPALLVALREVVAEFDRRNEERDPSRDGIYTDTGGIRLARDAIRFAEEG